LENKGKTKRSRRRMAGGGAAPPPKQEELQPHPVKDQLPSVSYCITSPPPWRTSLSHSLTHLGRGLGPLDFNLGLQLFCVLTDVDVVDTGSSGPDFDLVPVTVHLYNLKHAAEAVILGFQHYIVMLGTSVIIPSALVPQMGGGNVSKPIASPCSEFQVLAVS